MTRDSQPHTEYINTPIHSSTSAILNLFKPKQKFTKYVHVAKKIKQKNQIFSKLVFKSYCNHFLQVYNDY